MVHLQQFLELVATGLTRLPRYKSQVVALQEQVAEAADAACDQSERADAAEYERDEAVAVFVHRLKTPLTPMKGYATMLRDEWPNYTPAQRYEMLNNLVRSVDHLVLEIDKNLTYLKGGMQGWAVESEEIPDFREQLTQLVNEYQEQCYENLILHTAPTGTVMADMEMVKEMVGELIQNAYKYRISDTPVHVTLRNLGVLTTIEVMNMVPAKMVLEESIFEPMSRGQSSAKGHGFGLHIVRQYARAMGGDLVMNQLEGPKSRSTSFTISLPTVVRVNGTVLLNTRYNKVVT